MAKAIASKNINLAYQISNFIRGSYGRNYRAGRAAADSKMLTYFKGVKDTSSFLKQGIIFVDRYYLNISLDSARHYHQKQLDSAKAARKKIKPFTGDTSKRTLVFSPSRITTPSRYASKLNTMAWDFYQTGTTNPVYLSRALFWTQWALEVNPTPHYYDTLAHLYYRLQFYNEAEKAQTTAIILAKEKKLSEEYVTRFNEELAKMKSRTL